MNIKRSDRKMNHLRAYAPHWHCTLQMADVPMPKLQWSDQLGSHSSKLRLRLTRSCRPSALFRRSSLVGGCIKRCALSVCPSVLCLRFTRSERRKNYTWNLADTWPWALVITGEQIWDHKVKGQDHLKRKCKNRFSRISRWKVGRFISNYN